MAKFKRSSGTPEQIDRPGARQADGQRAGSEGEATGGREDRETVSTTSGHDGPDTVGHAEKRLSEFERRLGVIEQELANAHRELEQGSAQVAAAGENEADSRASFERGAARRVHTAASANHVSEMASLLQEQTDGLEQRVLKLDAALAAIAARAADLELRAAQSRRDAAQLRAYADTLKHESERREVVLTRTTALLETEFAEIADLRSTLSQAIAERDALQRQLARSPTTG